MASSEEYLDKLLKDMMGSSSEEIEQAAKQDTSSDIPQDVDTMGISIDSAPSLTPAEELPLDSEIADLMADIMPAFDAGLKSVPEDYNDIATIEKSHNEPVSGSVFSDIDIPAEETPEPEPELNMDDLVLEEPVVEETVPEVAVEETIGDLPPIEGLDLDTLSFD